MVREDAYYERVGRRYCELMGISHQHSWVEYAREEKRKDALAQARKEADQAANIAKAQAARTGKE